MPSMMPLRMQPTDPARRLDLYREALRRLLVAGGVAVGTPAAVAAVAEALRERASFRVRLFSFFEGLLRREAEPVRALELLGLLTSVARGGAVDLADAALREPLGELLLFVSEVEQGSIVGQGSLGDARRLAGEPVRRPRRQRRPGLWASLDSEEVGGEEDLPAFFNGAMRERARWRVWVPVAVFCLVFGLVAGLLARGHRPWLSAPRAGRLAGTEAPAEGLVTESSVPEDATAGLAELGARSGEGADPAPGAGGLGVAPKRDAVAVRTPRTYGERRTGVPVRPGASAGSRRPVTSGRVAAAVGAKGSAAPSAPGRPGAEARDAGSAVPELRADVGADLRAASFRPAGTVGPDAIARALLRGGEGGSHEVLSGAAGLRPSVVAGSAGIMAANVLASPAPAYPVQASAARVQGEVVVEAVVGRDGRVVETRVVSGPLLLRAAALEAVERWSFRPYVVDGRPAEIATTAVLEFRLGL